MQILQDTGRLKAAATEPGATGHISRVTTDSLEFGVAISVLKYAAIHQYGGQAGRGLKTTIPKRPYLVVQDSDKGKMVRIIRDHIIEQVSR